MRLRDLDLFEPPAEEPVFVVKASAAAPADTLSQAEPEDETQDEMAAAREYAERLQLLRDTAQLLKILVEMWRRDQARPWEPLDPVIASDVIAVARMLDIPLEHLWAGAGED